MSVTIDTSIGALRITPATLDQAPALRELRNDLARWMLRHGIGQWNPGEMPLEWIETCISWGAVHVVTDLVIFWFVAEHARFSWSG